MKLRVGGVPEHFNLPWKTAIAKGKVEATFTDFPGGTGAMCKAIEEGEVDVALLLTEGAVARALNNEKKEVVNFKLCAVYVQSPLLWGVHVAKDSGFESLKDLVQGDPVFAISRFGSGSHLMSYVLMQEESGSSELDLNFQVVGNLAGAEKALPENKNLVFLWEHFMTDPFVQKGVFKRIGDQPTPWPCFVVAVRDGCLDSLEKKKAFAEMLDSVREECELFKNGEDSAKKIEEDFGIQKDLASKWLESVSYNCKPGLSAPDLLAVAKRLFGLGRVEEEPTLDSVGSIIMTLN